MINFIQNLVLLINSKRKFCENINPANLIKNFKNVLILLPEQRELIEEIKFLISIYDKIFSNKLFLINSDIFQSLNFPLDNKFLIYTERHKNFLKLPHKDLIKAIQSKNFDTIIDCNLIDSNFHYVITKKVNAKYKIGIYRKNSILFNNLVMKIKSIESARKIYENFLFILKL